MHSREIIVNMHQFEPSRKMRKPGDVFTYLMPDGIYRFIRLVSTTAASPFRVGKLNLLYCYVLESNSRDLPHEDELVPPRLLLPPQLTNNLGWVRGYFHFVGHLPLRPEETFQRHCFETVRPGGQYFDQDGVEVFEPCEPLGRWVLTSYSMIDLRLSDILGIPQPEERLKR